MSQPLNITSPVGRFVMGSAYKPRDKDAEGKPLVIKNGPNIGQPRVDFFIALAISKGAERHWAETPWGQQIWAFGHQAFPQAAQSPIFAWKIEDGDSQVPNRKGRKPCDNEGWKGNWVLKFSGGFAPKIYQLGNGGVEQVVTPGFMKTGYYGEVAFSVGSNNSQSQPGIYLNHSMICFRGYGPEIVSGPDANAVGFGQSALPVGASAMPLPSANPMPVGAPQPQGGFTPPPPVLGAPAPGPALGYATANAAIVPSPTGFVPPVVVTPPAPVVPNMGFVAGPGAAPAPALVAEPLPPAAPVKQMTESGGDNLGRL